MKIYCRFADKIFFRIFAPLICNPLSHNEKSSSIFNFPDSWPDSFTDSSADVGRRNGRYCKVFY